MTTLNDRNLAGIDLGHIDAAPIIQLGSRQLVVGPSHVIEGVVVTSTVPAVADKAEDRWGTNGELGLPTGTMDRLVKVGHIGCTSSRY